MAEGSEYRERGSEIKLTEFEDLEQASESLRNDLKLCIPPLQYLRRRREISPHRKRGDKFGVEFIAAREIVDELDRLVVIAEGLLYEGARPLGVERAFSNGIRALDVSTAQSNLEASLRSLVGQMKEPLVRDVLMQVPKWQELVQYLEHRGITGVST